MRRIVTSLRGNGMLKVREKVVREISWGGKQGLAQTTLGKLT